MQTQTPTFDGHANFAGPATVATAPSPATSGASLVVQAGYGAQFPAVPFNATLWPTASSPTSSNAEIVRVTAISTDTLTIVRGQEGTSAQSVTTSFSIAATITKKTLTDIERQSRPDDLTKNLTPYESTMQTVEYGPNPSQIQTIFSASAGTAGVVNKIKITGGPDNGMLNDWLQISYDGGVTFPFCAELGTLFGAYPGVSATSNTYGAVEAACAHMATQQVASAGNFYSTHIMTYPIPFTNGILIQVFNATEWSYSTAPYAEVTAEYMNSTDVPPFQLQTAGTNQAFGVRVTLSALTNSSTTWTATVASTAALCVGQNVTLASVAGFTTNPNGAQTVASIISGTQYTFTATTSAGSYTANSGYHYPVTLAAGTNGLSLTSANLAMYQAASGVNASLTSAQIAQLASITGRAGWAVGLAYSAQTTAGYSYLERNFGWYVDGATPPTPSGTTTTPTEKSLPITAMSFTGTTVTATVSASTGIGVGQRVTISAVQGLTNVNGYWTVSATGTGTVSFIVATTPTGSFTAGNGAMLNSSGSPYGTQVGSPSMQTTGTEDTFDSAYYDWNETFPNAGVYASAPAVPATTVNATNATGVPMDVYIKQNAASATTIKINGTTVMTTPGTTGTYYTVTVPPMGTINLTYTSTAPTWVWSVSSYVGGGPGVGAYSSPCAMGTGNGSPARGNYYNAFLDIMQSAGGYRFNSALDLWLLTESHCADGHALSWCLLYYVDNS